MMSAYILAISLHSLIRHLTKRFHCTLGPAFRRVTSDRGVGGPKSKAGLRDIAEALVYS